MLSTVLLVLFGLLCVLLIFVVVIQPSHSEGGIASAFGGAGSESFFGTKAHQHINKFTIILAILFLGLAVLINKINVSKRSGTIMNPNSTQDKK